MPVLKLLEEKCVYRFGRQSAPLWEKLKHKRRLLYKLIWIHTDNQYENGNGEKEEVAVMGTPEFVSEPKKAMVNEGDTLRLPCIVDRLEGFVLLWKKNSDIITVGSQIINKVK